MPEKDSRHLLDRFAEIEDPHNEKGKRHPLKSILGLVLIGFMSGHKGYSSTEKGTISTRPPPSTRLDTPDIALSRNNT